MKKYTNQKHLAYVRGLNCLVATLLMPVGYKNSCNGNIQAHHLLKPYDGVRGMSLKANDKNVIPLCQNHHMLLHTKHGTEKNFFEHYNLPADVGQKYAEAQFEGHAFYIEQDGDLPF